MVYILFNVQFRFSLSVRIAINMVHVPVVFCTMFYKATFMNI